MQTNSKMKQKINSKHTFFKYCDKCGKRFQPTGRTQKLCEKCQAKIRAKRYKKMNKPTNKEKEKALKDKLHLELTMLDANLQQSIKNITTLLNEIDLVTA